MPPRIAAGLRAGLPAGVEPIWLEWLALGGLLAFGT